MSSHVGRVALLSTALVLSTAAAQASSLLIDAFDQSSSITDDGSVFGYGSGGLQSGAGNVAGVLGGCRALSVESDGPNPTSVTIDGGAGTLRFAAGEDTTGRGSALYNGCIGFSPRIDLTEAGANDRFRIVVESVTGEVELGFVVQDGDSNSEAVSRTVTSTFAGPASGSPESATLELLFSDLVGTSSLDLTNSTAVRFTMSTAAAGSAATIDSIEIAGAVVPLPAAGWLLIAGAGGLVVAGRRRKAA